MFRAADRPKGARGQIIVVFTLALVAIILMTGVVIDGGYGLAQRRAAQNDADFAALAGARIVAQWISGNTLDGTDANVQAAISYSIQVNGGSPITFGSPDGPTYVNPSGAFTGWVGSGSIPAGTVGVTVSTSRTWRPFFTPIVGINSWTAGASAVARGGYAAGGPAGAVFPAGIAEAFFNDRQPCSGPISTDPSDPCYPAHLTPGELNVPGGFGWMKFGCDGYGLGQEPPANNGGCRTSAVFLDEEMGPPGKSFGCCGAVRQPGSLDRIGSIPGNKVSVDCTAYVSSGAVQIVPVWDSAGGSGANAWYHIVGFTGFQVTGCSGGKNLEGVWRQPFFLGPTTTTPGFAGQALAVELIR
jgi:hypothetical protein